MTDLHSIDTDQRLYVISEARGVSCYGFDVLDKKARAIRTWLLAEPVGPGVLLPALIDIPEPGTAAHYEACQLVMEAARRYCTLSGHRCPVELCPALIGLEGHRVVADYYDETIHFTVGRTTGWLPMHLRLHARSSLGGEPLYADHLTNVRNVR